MPHVGQIMSERVFNIIEEGEMFDLVYYWIEAAVSEWYKRTLWGKLLFPFWLLEVIMIWVSLGMFLLFISSGAILQTSIEYIVGLLPPMYKSEHRSAPRGED